MEHEVLTVSEFNALLNQTLSFAYPAVVIEGEVSSFKINQGKWVFFDLKDSESTVSCFMTKYQLDTALEDGMLVRVVAQPNLTKWGKFSLTVRSVELSGEGAVKRAFELLKAQFEKEGLFAADRKRSLPQYPARIALITSAQAAAFNDFVTVLRDRWSGLVVEQAQVQVQGVEAPNQVCRAIEYFNTRADQYDVLVIIRGGGSAEDLQAFNSEDVVRAVYGAKLPTIVGIGHEDDVTLAELAADVRAATPTDAARRIVPDKNQLIQWLDQVEGSLFERVQRRVATALRQVGQFEHAFVQLYHGLVARVTNIEHGMDRSLDQLIAQSKANFTSLNSLLRTLDPRAILARGYAIATSDGVVIHDPKQVKPDAEVVLQLHKGKLSLQRPRKSVQATTTRIIRHKPQGKGSDDQTRLTI